jgi:hypothetical protein
VLNSISDTYHHAGFALRSVQSATIGSNFPESMFRSMQTQRKTLCCPVAGTMSGDMEGNK